MYKTTLKIDGMMCSMCEVHIKEAIRKAVPAADKVTASHTRGEASFLMNDKVDEEKLKDAIASIGYDCLSIQTVPYEKKGLFFWK